MEIEIKIRSRSKARLSGLAFTCWVSSPPYGSTLETLSSAGHMPLSTGELSPNPQGILIRGEFSAKRTHQEGLPADHGSPADTGPLWQATLVFVPELAS